MLGNVNAECWHLVILPFKFSSCVSNNSLKHAKIIFETLLTLILCLDTFSSSSRELISFLVQNSYNFLVIACMKREFVS